MKLAPPSGRVRVAVLLAVLVAAAALALGNFRPLLLAGVQRLTPAVLVLTLVMQTGSLLVCALALRQVAPRARFRAALASRWVRDGVSNLVAVLPGAGEAAGLRVLATGGTTGWDALRATAADVAAETLAQAIYTLAALAWAPVLFAHATKLNVPPLAAAAPLALAAAALAAMAPRARRAIGAALAAGLQAALGHAREMGGRRAAACLMLHLAAWLLGGLQVWAVLRALGFSLSVGPAIAIEAFTYAGRAAAFFVPAGVGVQEAAVVALSIGCGLPAQAGVALAVLLRLRDLLVGAPALLAWIALEAREGARRSGAAARAQARPS